MVENCKLCNKSTELKNSHLIPNFIHKWQKKTSYTGNIRSIENINQINQGGFKDYLLCGNCEQIFSKWEKYFAEIHFYPYINKKIVNEYNINFSKFAISLAWRILIKFKKDKLFEEYELSTIHNINNMEKIWRDYLLSNSLSIPNNIKHNIFLIHENMYEHPFFNRQIRSVETTFISDSEGGSYFYIKLPYFTIVAFIENYNSKYWSLSEIKEHGTIELNSTIHTSMEDLIVENCEEHKNMVNKYSKNQFDKVQSRFNNSDFYKTHAFKMAVEDYKKFKYKSLPKKN